MRTLAVGWAVVSPPLIEAKRERNLHHYNRFGGHSADRLLCGGSPRATVAVVGRMRTVMTPELDLVEQFFLFLFKLFLCDYILLS